MRPSRLRRSLGATRNKSSQNELVRIAELLDLVDEFLRSGNGVAERVSPTTFAPPDATTPNRKTGPDNARAGREATSRGRVTHKIEANYHDGVLRLAIPVAEKAKPRRIEISHDAEGTAINA